MIRLLSGDCRDVLPTLAANSVHCVVTSPPYYGLRDYGTALWDGGDAACDHRQHIPQGDASSSTLRPPGKPHHHMANGEVSGLPFRDICGKCGARRIDRQIGLERSPDAYIATMVAVFREVRRILRNDGVMFLNVGDSYSGGKQGRADTGPADLARRASLYAAGTGAGTGPREFKQNAVPPGCKPKDLLMMPARLALALQQDGWWLRSDIIWAKPNPMPESCTDRPTSAHEHVFLLTKRARYYYDNDGVREERTSDIERPSFRGGCYVGGATDNGSLGSSTDVGNRQAVAASRNLRNVWTIATHAFPAAHFATYPPELVERCIRAGTSERGCCASCGAPWVRVVERGDLVPTRKNYDRRAYGVVVDEPDANDAGRNRARDGHRANMAFETTTTGWRASCTCHGHFEERPAAPDWISDETGERKMVRVYIPDEGAPPPRPCTVLDPFAGSGTTLLVADRLQRHAIGIDLSTTYADLARNRIEADAPLFTSWAPAEPPEDERMADLFDYAAD